MATAAQAGLLPPGSAPVKASLEDGKHTITIKSVEAVGAQMLCCPKTGLPTIKPDLSKIDPEDGFYVTCVYPDGMERDHQVRTFQELAPKLVMNLRARYGVESINILNAPALEAGALIEVEVANGTQS